MGRHETRTTAYYAKQWWEDVDPREIFIGRAGRINSHIIQLEAQLRDMQENDARISHIIEMKKAIDFQKKTLRLNRELAGRAG